MINLIKIGKINLVLAKKKTQKKQPTQKEKKSTKIRVAGEGEKRPEMCYVPVSVPHNEWKHYVLQTGTYKNFKITF